MAAVLQCEICGGKLQGKPGGIFKCESCGMEYSTEWAKAKIQEVKGTVKVEGTVQVEGTVKVEGGVTAESLLKRAQIALEDSNWKEADEYFDKALDINPESAEAYLGKMMGELKCNKRDNLIDCKKPFDDFNSYKKVIAFAETPLKNELQGINEKIRERNATKSITASQQIETVRKCNKPFEQLLIFDGITAYGLQADGKVLAAGMNDIGQLNKVQSWTNIVQIAAEGKHIVGLKADGTVVATGENYYGQCHVQNWTNVIQVAAGFFHTAALTRDGKVLITNDRVHNWENVIAIYAYSYHTFAIKRDGTVLATGKDPFGHSNKYGEYDVQDWKDIIHIAVGYDFVVGLKSDGTVVAAGKNDYGQCNVQNWNKIIDVVAVGDCTYALKSDGSVLNTRGYGDELEWENITHICATSRGDVCGLKADGTVQTTSSLDKILGRDQKFKVYDWKDIITIGCSYSCLFGLSADGTVKVTGDNEYNQFDARKWKLFDNIDTFDKEREETLCLAKEQKEKLRQEEELRKSREESIYKKHKEIESLQTERTTLGIFAGKRKKEIDETILSLEAEIRKLKENKI